MPPLEAPLRVAENQVRERVWFYCAVKSLIMDVSNTALILAVRLLNINQLLCPEWVSEWHSATFSTVGERESLPQRQFSVCSRFANHEWIAVQTWITSSQFCVSEPWQFHSQPACSRLSSAELRKERINSWSDSVQFIHSKDLFMTRVWVSGGAEPRGLWSRRVWQELQKLTI